MNFTSFKNVEVNVHSEISGAHILLLSDITVDNNNKTQIYIRNLEIPVRKKVNAIDLSILQENLEQIPISLLAETNE